MGADMLVAIVAAKRDSRLKFDDGRDFINKLDLTDETLISILIEEGQMQDDMPYFDEDGKPVPDEIGKYLAERLDSFQNCLNGRGVTTVDVRDLTLWITGGLSWGDATDESYDFWTMSSIPGLLSAMGFEENWHMEDPTVSPDEEAAAIESIKQVTPL